MSPIGGVSSFKIEIWYTKITMITAQLNKKIENLVDRRVEQKMLEFLGDPDAGLELKKSFITELKKRMKEKRKTVPLSVVLKKYGLR